MVKRLVNIWFITPVISLDLETWKRIKAIRWKCEKIWIIERTYWYQNSKNLDRFIS